MHQGSLFIVIEGLDGSGKTSVSKELVKNLSPNPAQIKLTFEPHDASCAGVFIRDILIKKNTHFDPHFLPFAFATNRLDHCHTVIKPWLAASNKNIVLCDRYYLSSRVYQSNADFSFIDIMNLNRFVLKPDIIFFINVDNKTCYQRMKTRNQPEELFENNLSETRNKYVKAIQFLRDTRQENIVEIDGSGTIEAVSTQIKEVIYGFAPHLSAEI
jgi:dTMP kinase